MLLVRTVCQKWRAPTWVNFFLLALAFALPISSTGKSIFAGLAVATIALSPTYWLALSDVFRTHWSRAALLLFFLVLLACYWSPASTSKTLNVLEKYSKLLYLPILAVGFQDEKIRRWGMHAFLLSMSVTCLVSLFAYSGLLQRFSIDPDLVFRNHIMTGMMMSFAVYLCGFLFFREEKGLIRALYAALALMFTFQIFMISSGRTGYVIYFLLISLLMLQNLGKRQSLIGILLVIVFFSFSYQVNLPMRVGVNRVIAEFQEFKERKDTSVGLRLQFHAYAHELFNRHPLVGNGTASYMTLYKSENPIPSFIYPIIEPHSQYWLVAAEFGAAGLLALFLFFGSLFWESLRLKSMRPVALASLLIFCVGNLSDSLLFYSGSGYFFILFMALCLGESNVFDKTRALLK